MDDADRVDDVLSGLARSEKRGILVEGYRPGPQLERLLGMGGMARTVTLGSVRYKADGSGVDRVRTSVVAQAGRTNLLFDANGIAVALTEVDAGDMVEQIQRVFRRR